MGEAAKLKNTVFVNSGTTPVYFIRTSDDIVNVNTTAGPILLIIPNIKNSGFDLFPKRIYVNDVGGMAGTNKITIQGTANLVNGAFSTDIEVNFGSGECVVNSGSEWLINKSTDNGTPPVSDKNFVYTQGLPALVWTVVHNLNKRCAVQIVDNVFNEIEGKITWDSLNQVTVIFTKPKTGYVYCN